MKLSDLERCRLTARAVRDHVFVRAPRGVDKLVSEWPQAYTSGKSKTGAGSLMPMCGIAGALAAYLDAEAASCSHVFEAVSYKPAEWLSGQTPKTTTGNAWESPRGRRVRGCLSEAEAVNVILSHDAVDAIGIGLFALGRFARKRAWP